jgi:two-component system, NtrC family, sensor histidine kinase AtoS
MKTSEAAPLLQMRGISVSYGSIPALRGADFDLERGEIHALAGAHRAGKSSLVKLLSGAVRKDGGEILFDGRRVEGFTPRGAIRCGIGIVYQHLNVIPSLSAAENIFAGRMPKAGVIRLDHRRMRDRAQALFAELAVPIDVEVPVSRLSVAEQHMVELARVLSFDPRILILDEVSSKLNPEEMERIYPVLRRFREQGKSVIYITHNMEEIFQFASRVTIFKDGRRVDTERIEDLDRIKLIKLTYSSMLSREELRRQNIELYTATRYNENIIKNIPVGVIILNDEHRIHLINYAARTILGRDKGLTGLAFAELIPAAEFAESALVLRTIEERQELLLHEVAYREGRTLKVSVFPFRDEDYTFLGTIILMEDVSKDRAMDEYLLRAEKIASTAELAAGVAHEINNPLGIVQNYLELLKDKDLDPDAVRKLGKIENEVNRIEKIVGSLLSFSRFDDATFCTVDLGGVIEEVLLLLEHRFVEKGILVSKRIPEMEISIRGDESKLKQLFVNLIGNSVEAVAPSGGRIEAALVVDTAAGSVDVSIIDNGSGIPEELQGRIYDPFFSTKKNKKNAGLGLSISQRIVELHGGMITCSSVRGVSTRFSVRLPLAGDEPPPGG